MAELNSTDQLVRHDKDTIANGYDNEAYHPQTDDGEESAASDDERLRAVVTENGRTDAAPLSNGRAASATAVNGTSNMDSRPLDTRLHHYVSADDVDRKILNGSDGSTHRVSIPDDAVIHLSSGRVRVKKTASNSPKARGRESIPLEDMHPPPSYGEDDKSEKAELEAELSNHKNGVWSSSEGLNAYGSTESHFISEKLNGMSKSGGDESGKLPVNNHRKCLSRESSLSNSSEHKPTGEKLYFTEDSRKICPNLKRGVICGIIVVVISVVLLLCVLAATGIILSKSENTRYESGHSLPSVDSISHAGHSFRPRPSPKVPQKFLPSTENFPNTTPTDGGIVTSPPFAVTSKVPLPNDSSHSQTIVPNALVGEFTIIDENFTDDLNDNSSRGYMDLARNLETELRRIFRENGGRFDTLKILKFRPGSIKVKFVVIWSSDQDIVLSDRATEILSADLRQKNNSFYNFLPVDIGSIHFQDVFDECRVQKGGCSFDCVWNYDTISKTCTCQQQMYLLPDGKSCALIPETSSISTATSTTSPKLELVPTLPTFPAPETAIPEAEDHTPETSLVPLLNVTLTKESVTTHPTVEESTTIKNKSLEESTIGVGIPQIYADTTTAQPMDDELNTEIPPTHIPFFTEKATDAPVKAETSTSSLRDEITESQKFNMSTEASIITDIQTTRGESTDSIPIFEESTTEQAPHTVPSEDLEINNTHTEATVQPVPNIPITTMETIKETATILPSLENTTEGTTLKFHVVQPTTEVYTFNPTFDYTTEYSDTTIGPDASPSDQEVTTVTEPQETDYPVISNVTFTTQPEIHPPIFNATEVQPITTINPPWTYSEVNREGTLKEARTEFTTLNVVMGIDQTQPTTIVPSNEMSPESTSLILKDTEIDTVSPILSRNGTEEEFTTVNPEMLPTTSIFIPFSNRTSGVRYIDNFTDLYENITSDEDQRFFNTDVTSNGTVTEQTHHVTEFPFSVVNLSISDTTTNYPTTETTYFEDQFTDIVNETKPTGEPPFWIRKSHNVTEYTTQNGNFDTTEPVVQKETSTNPTALNWENTEIPFLISTNDSFSFEDEVHIDHINDSLTLPPNAMKPETTDTVLDMETTPTSPTLLETAVTTPEMTSQNTTEEVAVGSTLPYTESMFATEITTLLPIYDELNANASETENRSEMPGNYNDTFTMTDSYPSEEATTLNASESKVVTLAELQNVTDNPFLTEVNLTDSTSLPDVTITLILNDTGISNASSGIEIITETQTPPQDTALPIEMTDSDNVSMETAIPTAILDTDIISTTVLTETILNTSNTYTNETTDTFSNDTYLQTVPSTMIVSETLGTTHKFDTDAEPSTMNGTEMYETTFDTETTTLEEFTNTTDFYSNHTFGMETNETFNYTESSFTYNNTEEVTTFQFETSLIDGLSEETSTVPYTETTTVMPISFETESLLTNDLSSTEVNLMLFNATSFNGSDTEEGTSYAPYLFENATSIEANYTEAHYNWKNVVDKQDENLTNDFGVLSDHFNATDGNFSYDEDDGNSTSTGFEGLFNETTTNASIGIVCRDDQFICEPLNLCLNYTFMCDGIQDCPDGVDEYNCQDSCGSNFRCSNFSNMCIMSQAHCDGIWDCENGTDEENCTPTECAKHEVMCLDHSKCIRPSDICDLKYDCKDRSDEVGCVERTTCESGGRFFCNDGLCIPWSLKCDGEFDCKDKEDEGNCTCLNDEFQCNDGKCLKSSSRCDGHQDCHDADDEMGCVNVDSQHIVTTYEPYSGTWALLCAEDFNLDDGHYLCQELGFGHALKTEKLHVSFNGTWMAMRRENLTDASLWTERVSFVESCTSSSAAVVECQKFACGEYSGLLHRRKRDVLSSSSSTQSTQWPFIGYTSTFHSNRGCMSEILTPIWLITSAECLLSINKEPYNGSDWYVKTNIGRSGDAGLAQNHEVLRIVSHPHSSKFRSLILRDYDVALVRLKHALVFVSDKIGAICPPEEQVPPGITCFSGVLGTQKPRAPPPTELTINSLALQIMERRNCNSVEHYNNQINQRMLCTQSSEGHTICDNDEGTPLMCLTGINKWFLAGMLTYQRYCEVYSKHPAVFSNLYAMRKFIDQVTGQKQYEISYDPNVYMIIPPTTPSPTVPETTTFLYTTTESFTTELSTSFDYTITEMYDESEAETTESVEMSLSPMNEDSNVTELFYEENGTTIETVDFKREEGFTTTSSVDFTTYSNLSEAVIGSNDSTVVLKNISSNPDWNVTADTTTGYVLDVEDNFTTLQPFTFLPDINTTVTTMLHDSLTLGFENASDIEPPEIYEGRPFNTSRIHNETHGSMIIGVINETYSDFDNVTELFDGGIKSNKLQTTADDEITTVTLLRAADDLFITDNATELDVLNSTMMTLDMDQVPSIANETSFKAPERLTLTTLHSEFGGETTTIVAEINSPLMSGTEFPDSLTNETLTNSTTGIGETEAMTEVSADAIMKAARFESETLGLNEHLMNETTTLSSVLMNASTESGTQATEPTEYPLLVTEIESVVENTTPGNIMGITEKPFLVKGHHALDDIFAEEKERYIEHPYFDNETIIEYPDLKNTTEYIDDSNFTNTSAELELETTGYTELPHLPEETLSNSDLTLTTVASDVGTLVFETEVNGDSDLSITLNDSQEVMVKPIASPNVSGNIEETNNSTEYLARSRMLEDAGNSSGILFDMEHLNGSFPHVTVAVPINASVMTKAANFILELLDNVTESENTTLSMEMMDTLNTTILYETDERNDTMEVFAENTTFVPMNESETPLIEYDGNLLNESMTLLRFTTGELTIFAPENITASTTESCGVWDEPAKDSDAKQKPFYAEWPSLGYLQMKGAELCAASLISSRFMITSLNCVSSRDSDASMWSYVGGVYHENPNIDGQQNHLVQKIITYSNTSLPMLINNTDLALVKLMNNIGYNKYSKNVCLPKENSLLQKCYTTGWTIGASGKKGFFSIPVEIVPQEMCNNTNYTEVISDNLVCATLKDSLPACQMDAGTPLYCLDIYQRWEIQAVLTIPNPCDIKQATAFSGITSILEWISQTLMEDKS